MTRFGLIGYPLSHSFSKAWFTAFFEQRGLSNHSYENYALETLTGLKDLVLAEGLSGFSVTIPHKVKVLEYLDRCAPDASAVGAVNTVKVTNGQFTGYNTDIIGFKKSFVPLLKPYHTSALVFGTGGASRAVTYVLTELGIDYQLVGRSKTADVGYGDLRSIDIRNAPLLINTTPLGMSPDISRLPDIPYDGIDKFHLLYDLIYNPAETRFLHEGRQRGAQTKNGYEMLLLQAHAAWEIWNAKI